MTKEKSSGTRSAESLTSDCRCILCLKEIPKKTKPEHVLLNSLGGRMTVSKVICPDCNHQMGIGPDNDLAKTTELLRNLCRLKTGDGGTAPEIRGLEADGQRCDLAVGGKPRLHAAKPLDLNITEEGLQGCIEAYSDGEAERLVTGMAKAIAKRVGRTSPQEIEALKEDILRNKRSGFRPAPRIQQSVQFGAGRSRQSKAKACLVLWAKVCGNAEVNSSQYDLIRHFVRTGEEPADVEDMISIDTRALPDLPERFGSNPNLIWVGSNADGKAYGYFRLYGAIGWRFLLRDTGAPEDQCHCLISNPFNNKEWALLEGNLCPVDFDWIGAQWNVLTPDYTQFAARISLMMKFWHETSQSDWLTELISDGLQKTGCKEGEMLTEEHLRKLAKYIAAALAANILKKDVPSYED